MRASGRPPPWDPQMSRRAWHSATLAIACTLLMACAASPRQGAPGDPLEPLNRRVHAFNDAFDRKLARPVARGYRRVTPGPVDRGVTNFFNNLDDVAVLLNSALQLKGRKTAATTFRLAFNSTIGLYGLIDVAGGLGVPKENEDFGQTLGYWGMGTGPYLVIPVLGPSTLRDGSGDLVDAQYDPMIRIDDRDTRYAAITLYGIDARAGLLGATDVLDTAAIDAYTFQREAWLRRRAHLVHDGEPPPGTVPGDDTGDDDFDPFADEDEELFPEDGDPGGDGGGDAGTGAP